MSGTDQNIIPNITFRQIPQPPYLRPSDLMEVRENFTNVGLLPIPARNVMFGQMITAGGSAGTATPGQLYQNITSWQQVTALAGAGSIAEGMARAYFAGPSAGIPLDMVFIADAGGATKATYTLTIGGTWTGNGTTALQIGDTRFATGTLSSDTPTTTASEFVALINADPQFPFTAASTAGAVTLTAKNAGTEHNNLNFVPSPTQGDTLVAGMTVAFASGTAGTTNPNISAAITAITNIWYTGIYMPYQDTTNLGLLVAELARRYGAMVRQDARSAVVLTGTYSQALSTISGTINCPQVYALNAPSAAQVGFGSMPWQIGASMFSVVEWALLEDPSLEVIDVALPGIVGPPRSTLLGDTSQDLMLQGKGSTFNLLRDGTVTLQRVLSASVTSTLGVADINAWLPINEAAVATRIRYDWRTYLKLLYPQNKLAPDGSLAEQSNTNICTPRRAQTAWARRMLVYAQNGWIVNETADAQAAIFKIDANDPNRLDYQVQYTRIGNLIVSAGVLEFAAQ